MAAGTVAAGLPFPRVTLEGRLTIRRVVGEDGVPQVSIASSRPFIAAKLFAGSTPGAVLDRLPMVFSVCAMAHCRAAFAAFRQILELEPDPGMDAAHGILIDVETVREHGLRMLMNWPGFLGEAVNGESARDLVRSVPCCRDGFFEPSHRFGWEGRLRLRRGQLDEQMALLEQTLLREVFAMPIEEWLSFSALTELERWALSGKTAAAQFVAWIFQWGVAEAGASTVPFLPVLDPETVHERLDADPDFASLPKWHGHPCETTSLGRCCDHPLVEQVLAETGKGLLARVTARLVETARAMVRLRAKATRGYVCGEETASSAKTVQNRAALALVSGRGLGQVEAARGRLIHRVELQQGVVRDYRIVAPTEWNFHPQGAVAQALSALKGDSGPGLQQQAELLVNELDPCVGFELSVG